MEFYSNSIRILFDVSTGLNSIWILVGCSIARSVARKHVCRNAVWHVLHTTDILVIALYCSYFSHYLKLPTFHFLLYTADILVITPYCWHFGHYPILIFQSLFYTADISLITPYCSRPSSRCCWHFRQYSTLLTFVSLPYTAGVLAIASYRQILVTTLYCWFCSHYSTADLSVIPYTADIFLVTVLYLWRF